ncbi:MAG: Xaa-Pro peptidase family protein [Pseudomonadota bacterium]
MTSPGTMILNDDWSDLAQFRAMPTIDHDRLLAYRLGRIRAELVRRDMALAVLVSPISLRYAVGYRTYSLFQAHIPTTYLFGPAEGPVVIYNVYGAPEGADEARPGRALSFFDGADRLADAARLLAQDIVDFLSEIGTDNRRVAVEYVNPSVTQALLQRGLEVADGVTVVEAARVIKSSDEIDCIRWAIAVAELGIAKVAEAVRPGVSEVQLWGLLNYANLANNGDWHDGRMLASGPRINPWCQEASDRRLEAGDLVGFDTDMIGPFGYCADISRTLYCGQDGPTRRQKELYRLAVAEIDHNMALLRPGVSLAEIREQAFPVPEEFHENAYTCVIHGVGMCDEFPRVNPIFRGPAPYDGLIEAGMVICVESYVGAVGERDGVKLEQQVLVTEDGTELLSSYPYEPAFLD